MTESLSPHTPDLTPRQRTLLGLVVREFVNSAEPVGSRTLVDGYDLGVSSATVRNDLKTLEELGYLTHPHTSAGRTPTHKGYRYFVQHILQESTLPTMLEDTIRHQFYQIQQELDQWVRLAAAVLARTVQSAAITTMPRSSSARFKHLEIISLQPQAALVVQVLAGGSVRQQLVALDESWTQAELSQISARLNERLAGLDAGAVEQIEEGQDAFVRQIIDLVAATLLHEDERSDRVYREGLGNVLAAPEFTGSDEARRFIEVFENPNAFEPILYEVHRLPGVQVIIGGEHPYDNLPDIGLVLSRYGQPDHGTGILGVIGPMRMPYSRTISAVRFMSGLMSSLVANLYGDEIMET